MVGVEGLAAHDRLLPSGVDPLDLAADYLDTLPLKALERARDLCRSPGPGHDPEERGSEGKCRFPVHHDDSVAP